MRQHPQYRTTARRAPAGQPGSEVVVIPPRPLVARRSADVVLRARPGSPRPRRRMSPAAKVALAAAGILLGLAGLGYYLWSQMSTAESYMVVAFLLLAAGAGGFDLMRRGGRSRSGGHVHRIDIHCGGRD